MLVLCQTYNFQVFSPSLWLLFPFLNQCLSQSKQIWLFLLHVVSKVCFIYLETWFVSAYVFKIVFLGGKACLKSLSNISGNFPWY